MSTAEIAARCQQVATMERDMAEAKRRFKAAAEILNKWSQ